MKAVRHGVGRESAIRKYAYFQMDGDGMTLMTIISGETLFNYFVHSDY